MELDFITRGNYYLTRTFIHGILAQTFKRKDDKGKEYIVNWDVKSINLWSLAFPKEELTEVLATVQPYSNYGIPWAAMLALRKSLGAKPISKVVMPNFKVNRGNMQIVGIGIKEDPESLEQDDELL